MKIVLKSIYYLILLVMALVALILLLPVLPIEGNIQTKVVLSGSMEPAIPIGSVVVIKPQENYSDGDIITFGEDTRTSIPTTHRILESRIQNGETFFQTKGDANSDPDIREVSEEDVLGEVVLTIPFVGYLIDFAKKPMGFIFLIGIPAGIIVLDEVRKIIFEVIAIRRRKKRQNAE